MLFCIQWELLERRDSRMLLSPYLLVFSFGAIGLRRSIMTKMGWIKLTQLGIL